MAENKKRGGSFLGYFIGLCIVLAVAGACEGEDHDGGSSNMTTRWERMGKANGDPKWTD